ncbi:signal transduction protein [Thiohalobacter thiocyanaticus]|uniref:Signal transduction protein n=2 Tax=Thiohalobacter thiocyanaticus TaxID=585455 RepID=A0A1Z4VQG2_9GAMM|nr:signal transduction protein [Thiohalobacter thiocyanaticus]
MQARKRSDMAPDPNTTVLLIEESPTLRYALERLLRDSGFAVAAAETFSAGLERLSAAPGAAGIGVVIIGWPVHTRPEADDLFTLLEEPDLAAVPVLVMVTDPEPATRAWVVRRSHTAMLDWRLHTEAVATLNALRAAGEAGAAELEPPLADQGGTRILFVDDSPSVRAYYRRLLSGQGYRLELAANVDEGFDKARSDAFDIAIIDYFMPGANGDVLCRWLRDDPATRHITTAIFTSTYLDQVIQDSLNAGAAECMFKDEHDALFLARVAAMSRSVAGRRSIEAERQRLQSILNSVGEGVYGVDAEGRITFVNPAARLILGYDENRELLGQSAHELFHYAEQDGTPIAPLSSLLQSSYGSRQILRSWETCFWTREGSSVPIECTVYPLYMAREQQGSVVAFRDISERKNLEERLLWQATHDALTELFNRRYFEEQLEAECQWQQRQRATSALLYLDLDHFKYINDTEGHAAGDALLIQVGRRLLERLRRTDTLARLGGDEFAILLRNIEPEELQEASEAFRAAVSEQDFNYHGKTFKVRASIGAALIDAGTPSPGEALAEADIACHVAKQQGGNRSHVYDPHDRHKDLMDRELGWSNRLREALRVDNFLLHYQPIMPLSGLDADRLPDGSLWNWFAGHPASCHACFEVLLRLRGPDGEAIAPDNFIPTAERFYLMPEIDEWVLRNALLKLGEMNRVFRKACFSINVSGHTLCNRDWPARVQRLIGEHGVDPGCVTFEVTETAAICDMGAARRAINSIRDLGCRFSLDDFGTGFSSFSQMKQLPVDYIKIDGMFVQAMASDPIDQAMVQSMNDIAHCLGRQTVAEYVNSRDILQLLIACGVDHAQGHYIARPLEDPAMVGE